MISKEEFESLVDFVTKDRNLTREALAKELGYGKNYISEVLSPSGKLTDKFLRAFNNKYLGAGNKKPSKTEGAVSEPSISYGAYAENLSIDVPTLEALVVFLFRIRLGEYDGRTEKEVTELFWRERTQRILDRAKSIQTGKHKSGRAKESR